MKSRLFPSVLALPLLIALQGMVVAAPVNKAATGSDLTAGASWGGSAPGSGDVATWTTGSLGGALTIGTAQSWQGIDLQAASAAIITSGAGTLTLGSAGITLASGAVDLTLGNSRTFGSSSILAIGSGRKLSLSGGTTTFGTGTTTSLSGAGTMEFAGSNHTITGSGNLTIGSGFTVLNNLQSGSSSSGFSGSTTLNGGTIIISTSISSFGTGTLNLNSGKIGSGTATGRTITNSLSIGGDITVGNTTGGTTSFITFSGPADLGGATRAFDVYANAVNSGFGSGAIFTGIVSNGGITLNSTSGTGIMTLTNDGNTFAGATTVNAGNLAVSNSALATSASVTLNGTGKLSLGLNGTTTVNNLSGASGSGIRTDFTISGTAGARILKVNQSSDGIFAGSFSEGSSGRTIALLKSGTAKLTLSGTGGYTGGTTLSQGTIVASASSALGSSGSIIVNDAATGSNNTTLNIDASAGAVTIARPITIANQGTGIVTLGSATASGSNAAIFSGAITLARDLTLNGGTAGDRFSTTGGIGGTGNLTISGSNRVLFGTTANTFSGNITINSGATLQLSDSTATTNSLIPDASVVTTNGTLNLAKGSNSETIGGLAGNGTVQSHPSVASVTSTLIISDGASQSFSGSLANGGATGSSLALIKSGSGTQTLSGTSSYTGTTTVTGGKLVINGNISTSTLTTVQTGATLGGSGIVGALGIDGGGTLAPGNSPGTLSTGTLSLANTSILSFELNPSSFTVGSNVNDLIDVTGNLTLDGIFNLVATSGNFLSASEGDTWRLFNYSGSLTNNTLELGSMPLLSSGLDWRVNTATAGQVNLVVVPEPTAGILCGLGVLALLRRRR